jgi:CIC family chloride channel protein
MVVATGVATGLIGDFLMFFLFSLQHLAFGYHHGPLIDAVARDSYLHRVVPLLVAGAVGGLAWYLLRRHTRGESAEIDDAVWNGDGTLSFRRSAGTSIISEFVIGLGASIGREAAPKLMGGASGSVLAEFAKLSPAQKRLLVACGGGAGLACVYNVPLGGALFAAEILCGSVTLPVVLPALLCSFVATATAWIYMPQRPTYVDIPAYHFKLSLLVCALVLGPLVGLFASGYVRLIGWISHHSAKGRTAIGAPLVAFGLLGLIGIEYPQLFGNGKDVVHFAFLGRGGLALLFALFVLKPLVTALCLGSGAQGGLFTPTLATGAVLGGFSGGVWTAFWPGEPVGAFAMVGAAAMVSSAMQAPLTALALVLELTGGGFGIIIPMIAASVVAAGITRRIDGYSIYSARLRAG